ncbi:uncharacterized protein LACBIDRAFT_318431 [Laccaria bicolor S238N-H82]|uniref:Predicted protein n=1 Tax=Laccaria bicolor (strain S238N-H82 / ATCC MYA-4686) TaxID=486041 RepID=B0E2F3_LACBS|nr:uncharacterized protein LACBIDRAFT_318431 [Laccaria bicolor S238N-H82]EDQ98984.1 predicted protein [Laccaria bicolor S238N-H82]|eukprot:XP_001890386.1 predicted protein [Laccaria bicolor S238N-H82]
MAKRSLKPKPYKPKFVDTGNNLGKRRREIAAQAKLDEIAAAKRHRKWEQKDVLKQLLPSFVAASKEGQVTAYMSRACLVWFAFLSLQMRRFSSMKSSKMTQLTRNTFGKRVVSGCAGSSPGCVGASRLKRMVQSPRNLFGCWS